jgi:hypothetical protein
MSDCGGVGGGVMQKDCPDLGVGLDNYCFCVVQGALRFGNHIHIFGLYGIRLISWFRINFSCGERLGEAGGVAKVS